MNREYNNNLIEMRGPHVLSPWGISKMMLTVVLALMPTLIVGTKVFGARCLLVTAICVVLCLILETVLNTLMKRQPKTDDFTCIVTGMIIALNMPSNVPLWVAGIACLIAVIVVKGPVGEGRNIINPACTAVLFVYICLSGYLKMWPAPQIGSPDIPAGAAMVPDWLDVMNGAQGALPTNWELFLGYTPGAFGCVSAIAIILGGVFLMWRRVISFIVPASIIITCAAISFIASVDPVSTVCSGGIMMGAWFMANDPVTSPTKRRAMVVYGVGIGIITMLIRLLVPFITEGIYAAIIIMNLLSEKIDMFFIMEKYKSSGPIRVDKIETDEDENEDK